MTEEEFTTIKAQGHISEVLPAPAAPISAPPQSLVPSLEEYVPLLEEIRRNGLPGESPIQLVSYVTTFESSLTISDLDLLTDHRYKIYIKADESSNGDIPFIRINGITDNNYYRISTRRRYSGSFAETTDNAAAADRVYLDTHAHKGYAIELDLTLLKRDGVRRVSGDFRARGRASGSSNNDFSVIDGVFWESSASNLTSLTLGWFGNEDFTYEAWVYKMLTG